LTDRLIYLLWKYKGWYIYSGSQVLQSQASSWLEKDFGQFCVCRQIL